MIFIVFYTFYLYHVATCVSYITTGSTVIFSFISSIDDEWWRSFDRLVTIHVIFLASNVWILHPTCLGVTELRRNPRIPEREEKYELEV